MKVWVWNKRCKEVVGYQPQIYFRNWRRVPIQEGNGVENDFWILLHPTFKPLARYKDQEIDRYDWKTYYPHEKDENYIDWYHRKSFDC